MAGISTQSIFQTSVHESSWRSLAVSVAVHGGMVAIAFAIIVPAALEVRKSFQHVSIIAPLPVYQPKPVLPRLIAPKIAARAKTFVPPPVVSPPLPEPKPVEAPEIKEVPPESVADIRVIVPPAPKEPVQTGVFQPANEVAKAVPAPTISIGGFGDPHGAPPTDRPRKDAAMLTKVGSFDAPEGAGRGGAGGRSQSGSTVRQTGFGHEGEAGVPKATAAGSVRATGFGETLAAASPASHNTPEGGAASPVEILFKPKPAYTAEARNLRLEGEVALQVVFQANGTMRVVRVVRGLGHGLDEAAAEAALRVRFKPAMRSGVAVDTDATIKITFALT